MSAAAREGVWTTPTSGRELSPEATIKEPTPTTMRGNWETPNDDANDRREGRRFRGQRRGHSVTMRRVGGYSRIDYGRPIASPTTERGKGPMRLSTFCGSVNRDNKNSLGTYEYWKKHNIFQVRVESDDKGLEAIVDNGSKENFILENVADKLHLRLTPHPKPFTFYWLQRDSMTHPLFHTQVKIKMGSYEDTILCTMGRIGEKLDIDFVVSTGDNFYGRGLTGVHDPAFEESFTRIYTAKSLQKQWYSVLGNHDYRGNAKAQLSNVLGKIDSRWLCMRSYLVNAEIAEFFFVDTTPFVLKYFTNPEDHTYDWRDILPRHKFIKNVLKDLETVLRESNAKWKIVIGHHTLRSIGIHGDTPELVNKLLPILETYNVDFYMNGHDHCLEHFSDTQSSIQFLTSGGGSKAWKGAGLDRDREGLKFYYDGQGFMSMQLSETDAEIKFYDVYGSALHQWSISKQLYSHPYK
ncbi:hypothetical protein GIB67_008833 [Kingdonia uniflora]|uniref:acid phosphatase n=1 Tax=Kingdonia uniflora TaxID=39325 RepID=A0A7J7LVE3_9MAGN|nr:hypothetical protein GIB67_008833 [Kingdonia uniflora]